MRECDVVVLGGGPVGENVAQYAIQGSDRTALLIDAELFGGECSYYACMPSKALLRPLDVRAAAQHLGGLGSPALQRDDLLARRDAWVSHYDDHSQVEWAHSVGIETARGRGRLVGERLVEITLPDGSTEQVRARQAVVLATGSEPVVPPVFDGLEAWSSRDVTGVVDVPDRLAIVGGGVVAVETATWMRALGSSVTLLVRGQALLHSQEPAAGHFVLDALRDAGVEVRFGATVSHARRSSPRATGLGRVHGGAVTLELSENETLTVDEVLLATGRRPRLADVGLESVGATAADVLAGRLPDWLYAVGDASGHAPLTHWGKYEARRVGDQIADRAAGRTPGRVPRTVPVPQVIFTDPQVAFVGLTEADARAAGVDVRTAEVPFTAAAGAALLRDDATGTAKLVLDARRRVVVGATFVGADVAELLHAATIAITGEVPLATLWNAVPAYPTASELWLRLLESLPRDLRRAHPEA